MNIEYINPFIEASQSVLKTAADMSVRLGKVYIRSAPFEAGTPLIEVGLIGKIHGTGQLSIPVELAKKIVSRMMGGMEVGVLDELAVSALSELANMIMGNTATILYNRGIGIDITTPKMTFGDGKKSLPPDTRTISVPLMIDGDGVMELNISVMAAA
ncbi:MAG: chemotaxis protein CheX [Clostridiales bacterium]|jgi:chemotaxis protein CheX|nr:chemotaxis protein CheX [Clostridiales bacterium]